MNDRPNAPASDAPAGAGTPGRPDASDRPTAPRGVPAGALPIGAVFTAALALGVAGDVLLRGHGGPGLNFFLLFVGLGVAVWALSRRAGVTLSREALVLLGVGLAFGATLVLRASPPLRVLAFLSGVVAFSLPALRAGAAWLRRSGISEQIAAGVWTGANALAGSFRLVGAAFRGRSHGLGSAGGTGEPGTGESTAGSGGSATGGEAGEAARHPGWAVLRGLLLGLPFLVVFGALFMSADRIFAELVTDLVRFDLEELVSHLFVTAVLTWLACGYLTGFLTGAPDVDLAETLGTRPRIGIVEIGVALVLIDLLFAVFVGVQFRYLFGGSGLVEVTPGLTYAEYVREGFGQLALACALVLPSLLAADWLLHPRSRRDSVVFRVLGGILLLLLVVIIASALQRVRIYQAAYGLTEARFYGAAFLGWLTLLTGWFAVTVLRGRRGRFAFPALVSGFAFVALLLVVNPDVRIARTNLERAGEVAPAEDRTAEGRAAEDRAVEDRAAEDRAAADRAGEGVDARYLASLSADAVPTLLGAVSELPPRPRCVLARGLLQRWGPDGTHPDDWRTWNGSEARAREMVRSEAEALRAMGAGADACPAVDR